ncbi:hypothetical protein SELMODRAFT_131954 [Selaginella moellendorffii]|uniref:Uncharacterized protein n=1 Tax=Selaginella moellendorffii TaxID=88036 RepID=D8T4T5_SELML|nr:uncharacterized protein LOC9662616 [Selaginella moellendorffii]EFJ08287.1 hypothetical protein SELMODRAFT_131954 [Selaginella moellendorffii]|eukprot:XP_002990655.1 uncharacterized protein LOC9662616 [Selaginella moellendorffii]
MKEKAQEIGKTVWKMIRKVVKKPWEFTGPTSHPEYVEANQKATEYRRMSPATPDVTPIIPQTEPDRIFDIRYHTRETHRVAPPVKLDYEYDPHNPEHIQFVKKFIDEMPLPRAWVLGPKRGIWEEEKDRPDGGYQVGGAREAREARAKAAAAKAAAAEASA